MLQLRELNPQAGIELFEEATTPQQVQEGWLISTLLDMVGNSEHVDPDSPMLFFKGLTSDGQIEPMGFPDEESA